MHMREYQTGVGESGPGNSRDDGFTLIEIMVVVFLIALIAAIITPHLTFHRSTGIRMAARRLVREFGVLHWEAISRQKMIRLEYNLDRNKIRALVLDPSGTLRDLSTPDLQDFSLPRGVSLHRIRVLHEGKVSDGKTFTQFFPSGSVEPTRILIKDTSGRMLTLSVRPLTGRVKILEGDPPRKHKLPVFFGPPAGDMPSMEAYSGE